MGFNSKWIACVMICLQSVSYSVLVNGTPIHRFFPSRWFRQGDPLSSYLFIICVEVLSYSLLRAEQQGSITGVPIGKWGFSINHLFFADDSKASM